MTIPNPPISISTPVSLGDVVNPDDSNGPVQVGDASWGVLLNHYLTELETQVNANFLALTGAWTTWIPSTVSLPSGGAGVALAKYRQIGKTVQFRFETTSQTWTNPGGNYSFTLPVPVLDGGFAIVGSLNTSSTIPTPIYPVVPSSGSTVAFAVSVTQTGVITFSGTYETA